MRTNRGKPNLKYRAGDAEDTWPIVAEFPARPIICRGGSVNAVRLLAAYDDGLTGDRNEFTAKVNGAILVRSHAAVNT